MADLPGEAWLDEDGRHVWWRHQCVNAGVKTWMLPWPHWRSNENETIPTVTPSIVCTVPNCGFHSSPIIGKPPFDWIQRSAATSTESSK